MKTKYLLPLIALASSVLTGCNTAQTLMAQLSDVPLPAAVARKQYGLCRDCQNYGAQPNCVDCRAVQLERRRVAGLSNTSYQNELTARGYRQAPQTQRNYEPSYRPSQRTYQPQYAPEYEQSPRYSPSYRTPAGQNNQYTPAPSYQARSETIVPNSGRISRNGNPYPVRWFVPGEVEGDRALSDAVIREQYNRIAVDPELALAFGEYLETKGGNSPAPHSRRSRNSGYSALGY